MKLFAGIRVVILLGALAFASACQAAHPPLLPTPKKVQWLDGSVKLSSADKAFACVYSPGGQPAVSTGISQLNERLRQSGMAEAPVVKSAAEAGHFPAVIWVGTTDEASRDASVPAAMKAFPADAARPDGYVLRFGKTDGRSMIACVGHDPRGAYYGLQTLIQLISSENGAAVAPRVEITDWPTFHIRLVKTGTNDPVANVRQYVDLMPRYKASVIASQYQPRADRGGTWDNPGPNFLEEAETIGRAARDTGTFSALMYYGPFGKDRKPVTDPSVMDTYVGKLEYWISRGYTWIGIDVNDWLMEKDILPEEREKIGGLADIWTLITNEAYKRVRAKHPDIGFVSVPSAGHYKNATPEVIQYCKSVPQDVLVITVGQVTKANEYSGPVPASFLKGWAQQTGRKPFYWDNCLYRQLDHYAPFINRIYNFDSYANRFPPDFADLLGGPGIHLNGNARRWWEPGILTFLDYAWNPGAYNAEQSLRKARVMLWGSAAADAAEVAQKKVADLYGYFYAAHNDPAKASRAEADSRFAVAETAVRKLQGLLKDPLTISEIDTDCLAVAKNKMNEAFAPAKTTAPAKQPQPAK